MSPKFKPYFCPGCGVTVTREPWPHLDRALLAFNPANAGGKWPHGAFDHEPRKPETPTK